MTYEIYNMNTGGMLGHYSGNTEDEALDAMARDYGFADYADCVRDHGVSRDDAKAELKITAIPQGWDVVEGGTDQ